MRGRKGGRKGKDQNQRRSQTEDQSRQDESERGFYSEISRQDRQKPEMDQGSEIP
ncbi:MAG: hypothetical protein HYW45_00105 [Candidatus Daviesbacteria bacterium]|nr:MAG: hypothetical protein HYW45_00105 [Candidatus Daviesbacteria bacterium]